MILRFTIVKIKGLFGKGFLVSLFKYCENTCGLKSIMKIHVVVFKHLKPLFKQQYRTPPDNPISNFNLSNNPRPFLNKLELEFNSCIFLYENIGQITILLNVSSVLV